MSTQRVSAAHVEASSASIDDIHPQRLAAKGFDLLDDWKPRHGFLYSVVRAISARINQNWDGWPSDELKRAAHTFIGKPVFVNHRNDDPSKARGVVVAARYVEDGDDKFVEVVQEVDAGRFPLLAHEIRTGGLDSVSMGAEAGHTICSACGNRAVDVPDFCDHVRHHKGRVVRGADGRDVLVYEECRDVRFFELSYVFDPADETAVASKVLVASKRAAGGDGEWDALDWEAHEEAEAEWDAESDRTLDEDTNWKTRRRNNVPRRASRTASGYWVNELGEVVDNPHRDFKNEHRYWSISPGDTVQRMKDMAGEWDGWLDDNFGAGDVDDGRLGSRRTAAQATCPECGNPCGVEMEGYGYEEKYQEFPVSDCCSAELEDDDFYDDRADREYDAWRDDQMTGDDWHEGSRSWGRYLARLPRVAAAVRTAEEILAARFRTGSFNRENVIWQSPDGRWNRGFYREAELQHLAFGEVEAPENVDTLRDDSVDDGLDDFQYYIEPPSELRGPDISEAQRLDREQDDELVSDLEQQLGELGAQQDAVEGVPAQPMLEIRIPMPPGAGNGKYPPQAFQMGPAQPQSPEAVQSQPGMPPQQALAGRARR